MLFRDHRVAFHFDRFVGQEGGVLKFGEADLFSEPWNPVAGSNWAWDNAAINATKADAFRALPADFVSLGRARPLGDLPISWLVIAMLVVAFALWLLYRGTTLGRQMLATGANQRAARMAGVPTDRIIVVTHALSGALAGTAGIMLVLRLGSAIPSIGEEFLLPSFAAPAIGGTLLSGGVVYVFGTLLGGLLIGTIENGLNLLSIPNFWVQLATGLVLLLAVLLDRARTIAVARSRVVRVAA